MKKSGTIALTLGVSALVTSGCYTAVNSPWIPSWGVTRAISAKPFWVISTFVVAGLIAMVPDAWYCEVAGRKQPEL